MARQHRTRRTPRGQAAAYLVKATEFLDAAEQTLRDGRAVATTSLAVYAGINAADAICVARLGERAAGEARAEVRVLLQQSGTEGRDAARHLARLLPLKTKSEYDADDLPTATAQKAVAWARRLVELADRVVDDPGAL